jgi:hypothetical protein
MADTPQNIPPSLESVRLKTDAANKAGKLRASAKLEDDEDKLVQLAESGAEYSQKEELKQRIKDLEQNRTERKKFATLLFQLIIGWLIAIGLILFAQGMGYFAFWKFELSEGVMLALIGGTTVNVLGLFLVVVKYLFKAE